MTSRGGTPFPLQAATRIGVNLKSAAASNDATVATIKDLSWTVTKNGGNPIVHPLDVL